MESHSNHGMRSEQVHKPYRIIPRRPQMATSPLEVYVRFRPATRMSKDLVVEPNCQNIQAVNPINGQKLCFTYNYIF